MFLIVTAALSAGILSGILTGLIPGLHPNTVFIYLIYAILFLSAFPPECVLVFVVSLAITNTFTDFIPSLFLGVPDPSTGLSVLPGHQMLLRGMGYEALSLTVLGGFTVTILIAAMAFLMVSVIPLIYETVMPYIYVLLLLIVSSIIMTESGYNKITAAAVFMITGSMGFVLLNSGPGNVMFPALGGLFGMSSLFISLMSRTVLPKQETVSEIRCNYFRGMGASFLSGLFVGMMPGLGSSHAGLLSSRIFGSSVKEKLMALGGINTANMFFTLIIFHLLGKTRSGTAKLQSVSLQ